MLKHAELLKPFLKKNEHRLTFLFLPPYSPNLNAVERISGWLKEVSSSIGFTPQEKRFENQCSHIHEISRHLPRESTPTHWGTSHVEKLIATYIATE